jgi:hypothetical protein
LIVRVRNCCTASIATRTSRRRSSRRSPTRSSCGRNCRR